MWNSDTPEPWTLVFAFPPGARSEKKVAISDPLKMSGRADGNLKKNASLISHVLVNSLRLLYLE